jgi:putative membrane-bound dehydrogenase-like protein
MFGHWFLPVYTPSRGIVLAGGELCHTLALVQVSPAAIEDPARPVGSVGRSVIVSHEGLLPRGKTCGLRCVEDSSTISPRLASLAYGLSAWSFFMFLVRVRLLSCIVLVVAAVTARGQREYGFDNTKPSGQPYLTPEESLRRLRVPEGFEVRIAAAEPAVINPIAVTVDEKGRIWVVECYEYPKRTAKGKMPRDRIKVLESTRGDGVYDKVTVFAEGKDFPRPFDLASGIEVGNGGVYLGAPPYLWFLQDTDGDGKADKFEILLQGFGSQDTHEMLNTFHWGPDGRLYGLHGVFTQSEVRPEQADGSATRMNAAMWRYDTKTKRFEVFAEGTSNPWGVDWRNTDGQAILACCVIPHLFHMVPGGIYRRQAGQSLNPYAYGAIREICDHIFHKESGWAHAGLISLDTPLMPQEYRNSVIFGSIHGTSLKRNVLRPNGSTYIASRADDFLRSGDKNFRPINLRWGPNGEIFVSDWHDQNPCHQAGPDSWDYEHGRIYSIRTKGQHTGPPEDLGKKTFAELLALLDDPNPYRYRTALRLLSEKKSISEEEKGAALNAAVTDPLRKLWALKGLGIDPLLRDWTGITPAALRAFAVRFAGEHTGIDNAYIADVLTPLAAREEDAAVRRELASAALRLAATHDTRPLLHALMQHPVDANDPALPQLIWLAYERIVARLARTELGWLRENAGTNLLIIDTIVPRSLRRVASTERPEDLAACIAFVRDERPGIVRRRALEGIASGLQGRQATPPEGWSAVADALAKDADGRVRELAQELSVVFRDAAAIRRALATAADVGKLASQRRDAVRALGLAKPAEGKRTLLDLLARDPNPELRAEACRALAVYDGPDVARTVLAGWKAYSPALRGEAVNLLSSRKEWAGELLSAVADNRVARGDLTNNTILRMTALKDKTIDARVLAVWGRVRDTPAELNALIDRMRGELAAGPGSFERGRKVFENQCSKCHKFEGKGHEVGPALDGAGRDIEYLLINVLDPNRVVGAPYFQRAVVLKNGRVETGLLAAEDDATLTLKVENDALKVLAKKDIEEITVQDKSLMPEGLANSMTIQDFRDLVRYVMANPYLTEVRVAGPFAGRQLGEAKAPELDGNPAWQRPVVGVPGRITLPPVKEAATAVIMAEVTAPAARKSVLWLGSARRVKVWLNNKPVYESKPGAAATLPDATSIDIELQPGINRVTIAVHYQGTREAVFARFIDPERTLRYPEPARH